MQPTHFFWILCRPGALAPETGAECGGGDGPARLDPAPDPTRGGTPTSGGFCFRDQLGGHLETIATTLQEGSPRDLIPGVRFKGRGRGGAVRGVAPGGSFKERMGAGLSWRANSGGGL